VGESEQHEPLKSAISSYRELHVWPMLDRCEVVGKMLRALIRSLQSKGRA
jgi:hypothetical protein